MKARVSLLLLFILIFTSSKAQNLIINGSFETQINCCCYADFAPPWELASAVPAKLFDSSSAFNPYCGVPVNLDSALGYQIPRTGHAYSGFNAYWSNISSYREYLGYPLSTELENGKLYCLKFYVNLINRGRYGIDGIGAYFSSSAIYCPTQNCIFNYTPQVSNPAGNIILDTLAWTEISGCFIASGSEKYLTIGNFKPDSLIQKDTNRYIPTADYSTFYYIDDVSLIEDTTFGVNEMQLKNEILIAPNPAQNFIKVQLNNGSEFVNFGIYNSTGNLVFEQQNLKSIERLNISHLADGIYVCKILLNSGKSFSQKLVITKK